MKLKLALLIAIITLGVTFAYFNPVTHDLLFKEPENGNPLAYLKKLPEIKTPIPANPGSKTTRKPSTESSRNRTEVSEAEAIANQVPNEEVSRTVLQILAARKLADGISLSVTDREIILYGQVRSESDLSKIVEILERARESRRIHLEHVIRGNTTP